MLEQPIENPINQEHGEDDQARIRRERKEMQATLQSLKKLSKTNKSKRKETQEEIIRLEAEIEQRTRALESWRPVPNVEIPDTSTPFVKEEIDSNHKISKAQRRRDKKAKEEHDRQVEMMAAMRVSENGPRLQEIAAITEILSLRGFRVHTIASDGDCLYNAISHQLSLIGKSKNVQELRKDTADYIRRNKDYFINYMTCPQSNEPLSDDQFTKYCDDTENIATWGGQIELQALSNVLEHPIEIIQAVGPSTFQGDNYKTETLIITYHRHIYSLGEHYNSTVPICNDDPTE